MNAETLRQVLDYDPDTGSLTWLRRPGSMFAAGKHGAERNAAKWNGKHAGQPAFTSSDSHGYRRGSIFDRDYLAHRVAWAIYHGEWPSDQIDHVNGNRADNRIENLRAVTSAENGRNQKLPATNTSGVIGVCWHTSAGKWHAQIGVGGHNKNIGYFTDFDAAVAARKAAEQELGYSPNHGRTK